jgi:hypothetical protein
MMVEAIGSLRIDKTNIIHMTTLNSEPQRLKYIMHKVQDYSIRYNNAV